jgi:flagellar basal-body rod modification protein FlgD
MTSLAVQNSVNAAAVAASTTAAKAASSTSGSASSLTQADFLQLLTAQLKYQTPTNPADPTQLASEFAAISTVDGITQLNSQVSGLQTSTAASQIGQAASLVGKQVGLGGNVLTPGTNGTAAGAFSLAGPAQNAELTVLNPNGTIAGTQALGALPAGQQNFSWSGGQAGTSYTYQITATDTTGAAVSVTPYSVYTVQGVNVSGSAPTLNVQGSATPLPVSSVQTVLGAAS